MKMDPDMSLTMRKKIYRYCVKDNMSMIKTTNLLGIPVEQVREYVFLVFSDEKERAKVLPVSHSLYPTKSNGIPAFSGYYTTLTEEEMIEGSVIYSPEYTARSVESEVPINYSEKRSYSERLQDSLCPNENKMFLLQIKIVRRLHPKKEKDVVQKS